MIFFIFQLNSIRPAAAISLQQKQQPFSHAAVWTAAWWSATCVWTSVCFVFLSWIWIKKRAALNIRSTESVFRSKGMVFSLGGKKKEKKDISALSFPSKASFTSRLSFQIKCNVPEHPKQIFLAKRLREQPSEFSQTVLAPTGWIFSHSSGSQGLFPPCRNIVIFRISYICLELAKRLKPPATHSQGRWPLYDHWGHNRIFFFFLLECPVVVLLTLKWVGAVTPERSRPVEAASALRCLLSSERTEEDKSRTASCVRPSRTLCFIYSRLQCERLHVDVNTRPLLWIYSGILTLIPGHFGTNTNWTLAPNFDTQVGL